MFECTVCGTCVESVWDLHDCYGPSTRADYIHEDERASLGLATLHRSPLPFYDEETRAALCDSSLRFLLPPALALHEVAERLSSY